MDLEEIVTIERHPLGEAEFVAQCHNTLEREGALILRDFITPAALSVMQSEAHANADKAYFCKQQHTVYLTPADESFPKDHARNRMVTSSKGCICDDDVPDNSPLRVLYDAEIFRSFVKAVTGETALHAYGDPLSSINIHYAAKGQELGWHFDNSQFAITLLIQQPAAGARFEYVKDLRDADAGEMNYNGVASLLNGTLQPEMLSLTAGTLVLFRGRNSIHRVSPNEGDITRILAVLAYNSEPGIELSQSARMTFYGRLA